MTLRPRQVMFLMESGDPVNTKVVEEVDWVFGTLIAQCEDFYKCQLPTPLVDDSVGSFVERGFHDKMAARHYRPHELRLRRMILEQRLIGESMIAGCHSMNQVSLSEVGGRRVPQHEPGVAEWGGWWVPGVTAWTWCRWVRWVVGGGCHDMNQVSLSEVGGGQRVPRHEPGVAEWGGWWVPGVTAWTRCRWVRWVVSGGCHSMNQVSVSKLGQKRKSGWAAKVYAVRLGLIANSICTQLLLPAKMLFFKRRCNKLTATS